eukprot:200108-Rhodomonas_salina.2
MWYRMLDSRVSTGVTDYCGESGWVVGNRKEFAMSGPGTGEGGSERERRERRKEKEERSGEI